MADPADLESLAARLDQSDDYRILRRVPVVTRYADDDPAAVKRLGLIVDIETTGLDPASDRIIELACLPFHFSSEGVLYDVLPGYAGFEDPGQPLHEEVVRLTDITDDQLVGQRLDEQAVTTLATPVNLIIAHNAAFDRCFLERRFPLFIDKPWVPVRQRPAPVDLAPPGELGGAPRPHQRIGAAQSFAQVDLDPGAGGARAGFESGQCIAVVLRPELKPAPMGLDHEAAIRG
jgi:hypothetical protein